MKIDGQHFRTIWLKENDPTTVQIIDQRFLPHKLIIEDLKKTEDFVNAIREMHVRGAPLIGGTAVLGLYIACLEAPDGEQGLNYITEALSRLRATRPTAVDLFSWTERVFQEVIKGQDKEERISIALQMSKQLIEESAEHCRMIGTYGFDLIKSISEENNGAPVNILTHCNAGWIACIDYGTATSPIYAAHDAGIPVHVWVDETRPRNQGARLTAYELGQHGVPHTVIVDNVGGHLMQHGMVDLVFVGSDRTTRQGDVANKIGTYLKALAANDNNVPFYVTLPHSSIDWDLRDGLSEIPIEERGSEEVKYIQGLVDGEIKKVLLTPPQSPALNYGFDVTPAKYVTGIITERGICEASEEGLLKLYPEQQLAVK